MSGEENIFWAGAGSEVVLVDEAVVGAGDETFFDEGDEAAVVEETAAAVTLFSLPGMAYTNRKGEAMTAPDGLLEIHFKDRWYNVCHICEQVSGTNRMYINIAMPARWAGDVLEWVDLDIDYRVHPDGWVEKLDEDELAENARLMQYPAEMLAQAAAACEAVEAGLAAQTYPFDHGEQVRRYMEIKQGLGGGM